MKKLIFCFDGTANDPSDSGDFQEDSSISNVLKLHLLFGGGLPSKNGETCFDGRQNSFYYSGIGTRGCWLRQKINATFAPPSLDMEDILAEADKDLKKNYQEGGEIYIFGFSRGAAIARMFASNLKEKLKDKKVSFLGVFDTVAATKGSLDLNKGTYPASGIVFEDGTIGEHIEKAVHLVSIDERRLAFQPTLFNADERVTEIWFSGVHSDIGGGYWFDGLSDITLEFMTKAIAGELEILDAAKIDYAGLKDDDDEYPICLDDIYINPLHYGVLHEQKRSNVMTKVTLAPRLVRVNVDDKPSANNVPIIHHTVCERFNEVPSYRPHSLRDIKFQVMDKEGKIGEMKQGIAGLKVEVKAEV